MKASGMVRVLSDKYTEREKKSVRGDSFIPGLTKTHFFCGWESRKKLKKEICPQSHDVTILMNIKSMYYC